MGRRERPLNAVSDPLHEFARDLRGLRRDAGQPGYRRLAIVTHYSAATLARAASGERLPTLEVTLAYVSACGGDSRYWRTRWQQVASQLRHDGPTVQERQSLARAGGQAHVTPMQLPPPPRGFLGRGQQLAELRLAEALAKLQQARAVRQRIGDLHGEARTLRKLGEALAEADRGNDARACWADALEIFDGLSAPQADASDPQADALRALLNRPLSGPLS